MQEPYRSLQLDFAGFDDEHFAAHAAQFGQLVTRRDAPAIDDEIPRGRPMPVPRRAEHRFHAPRPRQPQERLIGVLRLQMGLGWIIERFAESFARAPVPEPRSPERQADRNGRSCAQSGRAREYRAAVQRPGCRFASALDKRNARGRHCPRRARQRRAQRFRPRTKGRSWRRHAGSPPPRTGDRLLHQPDVMAFAGKRQSLPETHDAAADDENCCHGSCLRYCVYQPMRRHMHRSVKSADRSAIGKIKKSRQG